MSLRFIIFFLFIVLTSFLNTVECVCVTLTATSTSKYIESHNNFGTANYANNYEKCWIISTNNTNKIVGIKSLTFDLQKSGGSSSCPNDRLTVYNSNTKSGKKINFCGKDIFDTLHSSGRYMYLEFKTNGNDQFEGFRIRVREEATSKYDSDEWDSEKYSYGGGGGGGLSGGAIAGIVIGSLSIGWVVWVCLKKRQNKKKATSTAPTAAGQACGSSACGATAANSRQQPKPTGKPTAPPNAATQPPPQQPNNRLPPIAPPSYNQLFGSHAAMDQYGVPPPPVYQPPNYRDPAYPPQ